MTTIAIHSRQTSPLEERTFSEILAGKYGFVPNKYQKRIYEELLYTSNNIGISALAGTGKTSSLLHISRLLSSSKTLFLAFNRSIATELAEKFKSEGINNVKVSTVHSLGLRFLRRVLRMYGGKQSWGKLKVEGNAFNDYVYQSLCTYTEEADGSISSDLSGLWAELNSNPMRDEIDPREYLRNVRKLGNLARLNLTSRCGGIAALAEKYGLTLYGAEVEDTSRILTEYTQKAMKWILGGLNKPHTIDFTDMLWLPAVGMKMKGWKMKTYPYVIVDEAQDLSNAQRTLALAALARNGRFIYVGDKNQCQPEGTKVRLATGETVNIENLKEGDKVTTFNFSNGSYSSVNVAVPTQAAPILKIAKRDYSGFVTRVETSNGKVSRYTSNHHCYAKFTKNADQLGKYIVYLMSDDRGYYRVGMSPLFVSGGTQRSSVFSLSARLNGERGRDGWVLEVVDSRDEALLRESYYSLQYGIPTTVFFSRTGSQRSGERERTQRNIDNLYSLFGPTDLFNKASKLLEDLKLNIVFPFHTRTSDGRGRENKKSRHSLFQIRACNLLPGLMEVSELDTNNRVGGRIKHSYSRIVGIKREYREDLPVYSLEVDRHHNYVADGILTHNCIYGFAGSDTESFTKLSQIPRTTLLPLNLCYRCGSDIIELAQRYVPEIEAHRSTGKGEVMEGLVSQIKSGDMVLSRKTAPIVRLCLAFLRKKIKAYVKGADIGLGLATLIKDTKSSKISKGLKSLQKRRDAMIERLVSGGMLYEDAVERGSVVRLTEHIDTLEVIAADIKTDKVIDLIRHIKEIFKGKDDGIVLMTIHKSKGLEADNIFILDNAPLIRRGMRAWEHHQEDNLLYVSITRAKKRLTYIKTPENGWDTVNF